MISETLASALAHSRGKSFISRCLQTNSTVAVGVIIFQIIKYHPQKKEDGIFIQNKIYVLT